MGKYTAYGTFVKNAFINQVDSLNGRRYGLNNNDPAKVLPKYSRSNTDQNTPPESEDTGPAEGKPDIAPVAPTVDVSVHAYVESKEKAPESMQEILHTVLEMNQADVLQGIIMSEILGKPKALRRSRWQFGNKGINR